MAYYDALVAYWGGLSGTTAAKLAAVNSATIPGPDQPVSILEITNYLRSNNLWLPIKAAAANTPAAAAAVDLNDDLRVTTIDISLPIVAQMLAALVAANLLTSDQSATIVAMKNTTVLWWQANGYSSPISENDLIAAGGLT